MHVAGLQPVKTALALTVAALAAVATSLPGRAHACDCAPDELRVLPTVESAGVPTNTRVWIFGQPRCDEEVVTLRAATSATPIAASIAPLSPTMRVLTPDAPLEMGTAYHVTLDPSACPYQQAPVEVDFTVAAPEDVTAPELPEATLEDVEIDSGSSCGDMDYARFSLGFTGEIAVLDIEGESTLDPGTLSGRISDSFESNPIIVGSSACDSNAPDSDVAVRFATFDLAGNFSGWTEEETPGAGGDDEQSSTGCSCEVPRGASGSPGGVGCLAALAVFALSRKRRPGRGKSVR